MTNTLRRKVINLLKSDSTIKMLDFYFTEGKTYHIDGKGFQEVATAIEENRIIIIVDPTKAQRVTVNGETKIESGSYNARINVMAFRDKAPDNDVIVHESTHALIDKIDSGIRTKTDEAVAFLSQGIYKRLESGLGKKLYAGRSAFMHEALAAAVNVAEKAGILKYESIQGSGYEILQYKKGVTLNAKHLNEVRRGVTKAGYSNDTVIPKKYRGIHRHIPPVNIGGTVPDVGPPRLRNRRR